MDTRIILTAIAGMTVYASSLFLIAYSLNRSRSAITVDSSTSPIKLSISFLIGMQRDTDRTYTN
ncbi:MAG TPA: hypothetical protein V6C71_12240 [Coleofasciculaceae cyanobacterium]